MFKKVLLAIVVLALVCYVAYAAVDTTEINFSTVTSGTFDQHLRGWFDTINADIVRAGGSMPLGGLQSGSTVYYVDGNKSTAGDGLSWKGAFTTLTAALAASHADIGVSAKRNWAGRNTIFCKGDTLTEDLTALAQKTDIIGVGNNNPYNMCALLGNHDIASTTAYPSCRFYNMQFYGDEAAEVWDVDGQGGLEFHGCLFQANGTATVGLEASECTKLKINGCEFSSADGIDFSSSAIEIPDDTTSPPNVHITNNLIRSDGIGINWDETAVIGGLIQGNTIRSGGMCIDDEGDDVWVINNNLVCLTYGKAAFDFNVARAQNNILTTPVRTTPIPYTNECAGAVDAARRGSFGVIYYVDGNMSASGGDGLTWETACQSLTTALAKSHANIAVSAQRNWAARNTIYVRGDVITEDLTALAQKTDIVGVGINNPYNKGALLGNHDIASTTGYPGCRFYNMQFYGDQASELWDIDNQAGLEFHECLFQANGTATVGLEASECSHLIVDNCKFGSADGQNFTAQAIEIPDDTIGGISIRISNNYIHSNAKGILWSEGTNVDCWIDGNRFFVATMFVDTGDAAEVMVINNMGVTLAAEADGTSFNFDLAYAVWNVFTGSDETNVWPDITDWK